MSKRCFSKREGIKNAALTAGEKLFHLHIIWYIFEHISSWFKKIVSNFGKGQGHDVNHFEACSKYD
tara:strand:+ start:135 stop:332 length:198 start_codon:yes stop_codon:yes gene_type:complete